MKPDKAKAGNHEQASKSADGYIWVYEMNKPWRALKSVLTTDDNADHVQFGRREGLKPKATETRARAHTQT